MRSTMRHHRDVEAEAVAARLQQAAKPRRLFIALAAFLVGLIIGAASQ